MPLSSRGRRWEGSPYDFSFSGLKSAVLNYINKAHMTGEEINVPDLVASFQNAVVEALVSRAVLAAKEYGYDKLAIAGGVASTLRGQPCRRPVTRHISGSIIRLHLLYG